MASPGNRLIAGSELEFRPHGDNIGFDSRWGHQEGRGLQDASGNPVAKDSRNDGRAVPGEWLARGILCVLAIAAIAVLAATGCQPDGQCARRCPGTYVYAAGCTALNAPASCTCGPVDGGGQ
jgi:hypothetical protein